MMKKYSLIYYLIYKLILKDNKFKENSSSK